MSPNAGVSGIKSSLMSGASHDPQYHLSGVCSTLISNVLQELQEVHQQSDVITPAVTLVLVGDHPAALSYALSTVAAAKVAGVTLNVRAFAEDASQVDILEVIDQMNTDDTCHGGLPAASAWRAWRACTARHARRRVLVP